MKMAMRFRGLELGATESAAVASEREVAVAIRVRFALRTRGYISKSGLERKAPLNGRRALASSIKPGSFSAVLLEARWLRAFGKRRMHRAQTVREPPGPRLCDRAERDRAPGCSGPRAQTGRSALS